MYIPQRSDREMISAGLSVLASYDPDGSDRLGAAYEACLQRDDYAGVVDVAYDLVESLYEEGADWEADQLREGMELDG